MPNCFKCDTPIKAAAASADEDFTWEVPCGVHFQGGWNYGSTLYDASMDGLHVEIIVCDKCIREAKDTNRIREVQKYFTPASRPQPD